MSEIKVDRITDKTGSETIPPEIPALESRMAKAWVSFNGTGAVAIRKSHNVSSVTDTGTGSYLVSLATPEPDGDYAIYLGGSAAQTSLNTPYPTTNEFNVLATNSGGTPLDVYYVYALVFSN